MNLVDSWIGNESAEKSTQGITGVVTAIVTNNQDPQKLGRVKVKFPCWGDAVESTWARMVAPMAGDAYGIFLLPEVDDEVLVVFAQGDPRCPYVMGMLWNGKRKPPLTNDDGNNHLRTIKSRSGHSITFNDEPGSERLEITSSSGHVIRLTDEGGKEKIELKDKSESITVVLDSAGKSLMITADEINLSSSKDINLSASQGTIKLNAQKLEMSATSTTTIKAGAELKVESDGLTSIKGSMVNIN